MTTTILSDRTVLAVSGRDRTGFLEGLVTNTVADARPGRAVWAGFLTPQGRYLADFFIFSDDECLYLDCWTPQADMLATKLARFRLRADVRIEPSALRVVAGWDTATMPDQPLAAEDPRLPDAGWRALVDTTDAPENASAYEGMRVALGLPASVDFEPEKTLALEADFDVLNGVSWTKGCYMGQELTARTHYRALLKRRLVPVEAQGELPPFGAPITLDSDAVGELRSTSGRYGIALLRREAWHKSLACAGVTLVPKIPPWLEAKISDTAS